MTNARTTAPRPRIIERWFPCAEVSAASGSGWGSSNSETLLMSWFAKRPLAQSRAAVLTSLLPWPEDRDEQARVQAILREALGACQDPDYYACRKSDCEDLDCSRKGHMKERPKDHPHNFGIVDCARLDPHKGYDAARTDVLQLLKDAYPDRPAEMLDPFSGRGLIPVEAARYGQQAHAIDYSPVATLASRLLIDWPFRDWSNEPQLPFDPPGNTGTTQMMTFDPADPLRLVNDIAIVQAEVQRRIEKELDAFYPDGPNGEKPWGYLWASVIPCDGCGREFPLYGSNVLRKPNSRAGDKGASFELNTTNEEWTVTVIDGITDQLPTMRARSGTRGKRAWCPHDGCGYAHELAEHKKIVQANYHSVEMIVVADLVGADKWFREPTEQERAAAAKAAQSLSTMTVNGLAGRPDEVPLKGTDRIGAVIYGAQTMGDLSIDRQNLQHAHIAKAIALIAIELRSAGCSPQYASALAGYCAAVLARKSKYATRGARLQIKDSAQMVGDIFVNESVIAFNYDFFEAGIGAGPGTWQSVAGSPSALSQLCKTAGRSAKVRRGSALHIPHRDLSLDAVVTDPPYEMMITYSDASDLFYVWLKRALAESDSDFAMSANPKGTQEKTEEIIVHKHYNSVPDEHRTPDYYRARIAQAFAECRRVVHSDGVVTIVFGHGDPEAWRALLDAITAAGLVLTGAWPANTEKGGAAGSANINTTLTLACRPAPADRPTGRAADVDAELRALVAARIRDVWEPSGLSYFDQKMAAAGPALEVVGRYSQVLDARGRPVDLSRYLPIARQAVTDAHDWRFDSLPLETFDRRTRFVLEWVQTHNRRIQAKSEARYERLAADMEEHETLGLLYDVKEGKLQGIRLAYSTEVAPAIVPGCATVDVALAAAAAWRQGTLADAAEVVRRAGLDASDAHFWAVVSAMSKNLPETDKDGAVWTTMTRQRAGITAAVESVDFIDASREKVATANPALFDVTIGDPNSLFGSVEETNQ